MPGQSPYLLEQLLELTNTMDEHPFHHPFHNLKEASMLVWALSSEKIASQLLSKPAPHTPKAGAMARAALRCTQREWHTEWHSEGWVGRDTPRLCYTTMMKGASIKECRRTSCWLINLRICPALLLNNVLVIDCARRRKGVRRYSGSHRIASWGCGEHVVACCS